MDFFITGATYKLLIFLCVTRGTDGLVISHLPLVTAVEGQNVTLPCVAEELHDGTIVMLVWTKQQKGTDQKITVFYPGFPIKYYTNDSALETRHSVESGMLLGSVLNLFEVTENDSGNYVCEMTSFPHGSSRVTTMLNVTGYSVSLKSYPYGFVKEGDDVKITCSASPSSLGYKLRRSKDKLFLLDSSNGEFVLPNVTRNDSDQYVCFPRWDSPAQHQQRFNTTMELTVNFIDSAECNASSPLKIAAGEDLVVACIVNASQPLHYTWMKGDTTISRSDTLSLRSVTFNDSGTYSLTAASQSTQLQTDVVFTIDVFTSEELTTGTTSPPERNSSTASPFLNQTTQQLTNFTSVYTSTWNTGVTLTTTASAHFPTSTAQPNATMTTVEPGNTSHESLNVSFSAPSVGRESTVHPYVVNATGSRYTVKLSTTADPATRSETVAIDTIVTTQSDSNRATYIIIPVVLLVLMLAVLLYRRRLVLKRMDMPPPFKPPPPPVKYTSVRNHDVPLTDILI